MNYEEPEITFAGCAAEAVKGDQTKERDPLYGDTRFVTRRAY